MSTTEVGIALEWLMTTLRNDNALTAIVSGIFRGLAPSGTLPPWVIVGYQVGQDTLTMNAVRILSEIVWQIKVVGPADMTTQLVLASSALDDALKRASGTTEDGIILFCYREQPLQLDELVNGVLYTNIGGLYRTAVQQM